MTASKSSLRPEAERLRRLEYSYDEISAQIGVSKGTLSSWLGDKPYSKAIKLKLNAAAQMKYRPLLGERNRVRHALHRAKRAEAVEREAAQIAELTESELRALFIGLYWGEGAKRTKSVFAISNCDPQLLYACRKVLVEQCGVSPDRLRLQLQLHQEYPIEEAIAFWSERLSVPPERIYTLVVKSRSSGKEPRHRQPYGTCSLSVYDYRLKDRVDGWLLGVRTQFTSRGPVA